VIDKIQIAPNKLMSRTNLHPIQWTKVDEDIANMFLFWGNWLSCESHSLHILQCLLTIALSHQPLCTIGELASGYKVGLGGGSHVASHALIRTKLAQRSDFAFYSISWVVEWSVATSPISGIQRPNNTVEAAELQSWGKDMNDFVRRANVFSGRVTSSQKGTFGN